MEEVGRVTACLPNHLWRYAGMVDASPQPKRGLFLFLGVGGAMAAFFTSLRGDQQGGDLQGGRLGLLKAGAVQGGREGGSDLDVWS